MAPPSVIHVAVGGLLFMGLTYLFIRLLGFSKQGIVAGSLAAFAMSHVAIASGGGVAAGSTVAVLQSAGAGGAAATYIYAFAGTLGVAIFGLFGI